MEKAELIRCTPIKGAPQIGLFVWKDEVRFLTLELPYKDNLPIVSCIEPGTYNCKQVVNRRTSGGMYIERTFLVEGVPNRSGILFHIGNTVIDTNGCILVGMKLGFLDGQRAVLESTAAFRLFNDLTLGMDRFQLWVRHG